MLCAAFPSLRAPGMDGRAAVKIFWKGVRLESAVAAISRGNHAAARLERRGLLDFEHTQYRRVSLCAQEAQENCASR